MTEQQHNNGLDTKGLTALFPASAIQWRAGATNDKDNPTEALATGLHRRSGCPRTTRYRVWP